MSPERRIAVVVHSDDPVVHTGVVSILRPRQELNLLSGEDQEQASVVVACVDVVDEAALGVLRKYWRAGMGKTVLLAGRIKEAELRGVLECGVRVIVRRQEASPERIVRAIQCADSGAGDLPPDILGSLLGHIGRSLRAGTEAPLTGLSERELDVVRLVSEGLETREIAKKLSYSERTVKSVLQGVMLRLDLHNRPHLVAYAAREGYLR